MVQIRVRDARASYMQSLSVLREAKACSVYTKSSIMLGLGETDDEIIDTMLDLRDAGAQLSHLTPKTQRRGHSCSALRRAATLYMSMCLLQKPGQVHGRQ